MPAEKMELDESEDDDTSEKLVFMLCNATAAKAQHSLATTGPYQPPYYPFIGIVSKLEPLLADAFGKFQLFADLPK